MPSKDKLRRQKEKEEQREKEEYEKKQDEYWNEGTNKKAEKKAKLEHEKQMEKLQKAKEKKELEDADNMMFENSTTKVKKNKKNKKDDFSLLNEALKNAPKTKAQRDAEKKTLELEELKKKQEVLAKEKKVKQELLEKEKKQNELKGISYTHNEIMNVQINNTLNEGEEEVTGIDNILDVLSNNTTSSMSFDDFYNQQLPILKEESPGLRLSQYKDKIFQLWKKSPYYIK